MSELKRKYSGVYGAGQPLKRSRTSVTVRPQSLPAKVKTMSTRVNRLLRAQEKKFHNVTFTAAAFSPTASLTALNSVVQGDDATNRDGRRILMKGLYAYFRTSFLPSVSASTRVMIVYDKQPNAASPTVLDVLDNSVLDIAAGIYNESYRDRFVILMDSISGAGMRSVPSATSTAAFYEYSKYIPLGEKSAVFAGSATAIPTEGALFALFMGPATATVSMNARLHFVDA